MLKCSNVTATLLNGHILFPAFSMHVDQGDKLAIISEEGNGKSTLLQILMNRPVDYVQVSGHIQCDDAIGYLSQQFPIEWNEQTPLDYLLKENPEATILPEQYNECVSLESLCHSMHIHTDFIYRDQMIKTLSGGEKVRLQMLKLMNQHCSLYILDEPTNDLDIPTLVWMEEWINRRKEAVIYVSHDVTLLQATANRILHLEQRNKKSKPVITLYNGKYETYIEQRANQHLKDVHQSQQEKRSYYQQKQRINDIYNAVQSDLRSVSRQDPRTAKNLKDKMRNIKSTKERIDDENYSRVDSFEEEITLRFDAPPLSKQKVVLDIKNEHVYDLIQNIHFFVQGQDKVLILGENGCGKSLFMNQLYQQVKHRNDLIVGYMPQNYRDLFKENDTPISFLRSYVDSLTDIQTMLGNLKFTVDEMNQSIFDCSYGQQAKVFLASFVLRKCNVIILDEPTRNLSPLSQPVLIRSLQDFKGCLLCVTHDRNLIEGLKDARQIHIEDKQWIERSKSYE